MPMNVAQTAAEIFKREGVRVPDVLPAQSPHRVVRGRRHPSDHRTAGAHRRAHGRCDGAPVLGRQGRRVLHAVRPRRRERFRRRCAGLFRRRADGGDPRGLLARAGVGEAGLQRRDEFPAHHEVVRADQHGRGHRAGPAPRVHSGAQRPSGPGAARDSRATCGTRKCRARSTTRRCAASSSRRRPRMSTPRPPRSSRRSAR